MFGEGFNLVPKRLFLAWGTLVLGPLTTLAHEIMVVGERGERWKMSQMIDWMNQMMIGWSHLMTGWTDWRID